MILISPGNESEGFDVLAFTKLIPVLPSDARFGQ
jgi:hypothetical protein